MRRVPQRTRTSWLALAVVASIPLALGWFVLAPVFVASMYASYRDIFYED